MEEIPKECTAISEALRLLLDTNKLERLPESFYAFPEVDFEFPEVDEGALPKLQTVDFSGCLSLGTLPLSLEVLSCLRNLILWDCDLTLQDSCRTNCEKSSIWRRFDIRY